MEEIIDPELDTQEDEWTLSSVHKMAELAFRCLAYESGMRPSMMEVSIELEQICLSRRGSVKSNAADSLQASSSCSSMSSVRAMQLESDSGSGVKRSSPVSVQEPWLSGQSSPSSFGLLNHAVQ